MRTMKVNCETGEISIEEVTDEELARHTIELQEIQRREQQKQEIIKSTRQKREQALTTILNAPEISCNPALRDALAHLLGGDGFDSVIP